MLVRRLCCAHIAIHRVSPPHCGCATYRVLLWRVVGGGIRALIQRCCCRGCVDLVEPADVCDLSFDMALWNQTLSGVTTYRLPHHPRYASVFNGKLHRTIWHRAQGTELYTRVISVHAKRGGSNVTTGKGAFIVARGVVRDLAGADLESAAVTTKSSANLGASKVLTASGAIEAVSMPTLL